MKTWLENKIKELYPDADFDVLTPPSSEMGDYSINIAFFLAGKKSKSPKDIGEEVVAKFSNDKEFKKCFSKIEVAGGGFINFYLSDDFARSQLAKISGDKNFGFHDSFKGKKVIVEFTDPNPFKIFHIGHLMSNAIGEAIARLYEALGARVLRVNYQGDVGLHVAKTIWAILYELKDSFPKETEPLGKRIEYLGNAYVIGASAYENEGEPKARIEEINKKIYDRSDGRINKIYDLGKRWSLEYFEIIYKKLGTKFDHYFFESETGKDGLRIIDENEKIFTDSEGAVIFRGEDYGLHSRVFINAQGLPTYEAKELGLNEKKFEFFSPDLSIIVTGNEINDYFKVLLKVMELIMPDIARRTRHIGHGMMRFASGKMSSRTGDVITAESLIGRIIGEIRERENNSISAKSYEEYEIMAIAAVKYSILKQSIGRDIIFDFEKALSIKGDAAPYLQYTYARLKSILRNSRKRSRFGIRLATSGFIIPSWVGELGIDLSKLKGKEELIIIKHLINFPDVVKESAESYTINNLALYLYKLATHANYYYETVRVLDDAVKWPERNARLLLVETVARTLRKGLDLLGIKTLEKI